MSLDSDSSNIPVIVQGEDKVLTVGLTKLSASTSINGTPFDSLASATEVKVIMLNTDQSYLVKLMSTGGVVVTSGLGGKFQIIIAAAQSALLALSPSGLYSDMEVHVTIGGKLTIVILTSVFQVIAPRFP